MSFFGCLGPQVSWCNLSTEDGTSLIQTKACVAEIGFINIRIEGDVRDLGTTVNNIVNRFYNCYGTVSIILMIACRTHLVSRVLPAYTCF